MTPESLQSLIAIAIGFSVGGMLASGYQMITSQLPSFGLLQDGATPAKVAAVPLLVLSGPFLIMRNTLLARRNERGCFEVVFAATLLAGFWSLASGTALVMLLKAAGLLVA